MTASTQDPQTAPTPFDDGALPTSRVHSDIAALTHAGLVRPLNEDSYAVFRLGRFLERVSSNVPEEDLPSRTEDTGNLMMVADGLGGHSAGEVASRTTLITMLQLVLRSPKWALKLDDAETREAEIQGLMERARRYLAGAHEALRARAASERALRGMGTTLTGAYCVGNDLFVIHVGDSRAYMLRRGRLVKITRDHTLAQTYADQGMIPQAEVEGHELGHVLTRAVGTDTDEVESDIHHLEIEDGDRLLLCSDGLTRMVDEPTIATLLGAQGASQALCKSLVVRALENGGTDNVTAIVATFRIG